MRREADAFIREVLFVENGGLRELLTADYTVAEADVAALYGVEITAGPERIQLDPSQRAGLLTLSGFLAKNADAVQSDPIHRGVFVNLEMLCFTLPPPPDNVSGLPAQESGMTNRQRVEAHTGDGTCGEGCHSNLINPPGFAFEHYDNLGRYRSEDNGQPVDASDSIFLDGVEQSWTNGVDFSFLLSESQQVHDCYAKHIFQFTHGREIESEDLPYLEELGRLSFDDTGIVDMAIEAVLMDSFSHRGAP